MQHPLRLMRPRSGLGPPLAGCLSLLLAVGLFCTLLPRPTPAAPATARQIVQKGCGAAELTSGPERALLTRIQKRLGPVIKVDGRHIIYVALARSNAINSWELSLDATHFLVCIPVAMVRFMSGTEGELAFVVSHELGHALDDLCRTAEGRLAVAKSQGSIAAALGELFGGARGAYQLSGLAQEKGCEERADEIGFLIFTRAGYNPFDAAGAFGRLEMYNGDTGGVLSKVKALGSGHPMTADRIKHMRQLLIRDIQEAESHKKGR